MCFGLTPKNQFDSQAILITFFFENSLNFFLTVLIGVFMTLLSTQNRMKKKMCNFGKAFAILELMIWHAFL